MDGATERAATTIGGRPASAALGRRLLATGVLFLAAAGLLLWWREGDAIFANYLLAAVAWCF